MKARLREMQTRQMRAEEKGKREGDRERDGWRGEGGLCQAKYGVHKESFVLLLDGRWLCALCCEV